MINIFKYLDHREYLRDYFADKKKESRSFSHRYLARKLELATSNFILLVMQGKRSLSPALCFKISQAFKHSAREADYFQNVVQFSQSTNNKEKDQYFVRIALLRRTVKVEKIEEKQYQYYSDWFNIVIRELATHKKFTDSPEHMARRLRPAITATQFKKSIQLLLDLNLLKKTSKGYLQNSPVISTGPEVNSLAIANFHRTMATLAARAVDNCPKTERNFTACTIFASDATYEKIKEEVAQCRSNILALADIETNPQRVYQTNFQIFPVSKDFSQE